MDYVALDHLPALKTLLGLYHYSKSDSGERKIKGLSNITVQRDYQIHKGCCIQGQHLCLEINGSFFSSTGDVALFAKVFAHFLRGHCPINGFIKLSVTETGTGKDDVFRFMVRE